MNERIEKFIDDAKLTAVCEMFEDELVEFAELIIQECIDVVIESDPSPKMAFNEPYRSVVENIKEHFGVE